jgi:hypothetical protein
MARQGGYFYRHQAIDCGYRSRDVAALLRAGEWRKIRYGAYTTREVFEGLDDSGRYTLLVRSVAGRLKGDVVVTHVSALAVLGVPTWGVDRSLVHVHRSEGHSSRWCAGVVHHRGRLADDQIVDIDGLRVTIPERSVLDVARTLPFEAAVVAADAAARHPTWLDNRADDILEQQRDWAGSVRAGRVLRFADPRAQTVGESRARVLMARIGLPRPDLQRRICDPAGRLLGITDFYIEEFGTAVEFDGRVKYGRSLYEADPGLGEVDVGGVVWAEKLREDAIRDSGHEMVRLVWRELDGQDAVVRGRFDRAFERARRKAG